MEEVIRYLLLLNHPENSDFSGHTTFKSYDLDVGLLYFSLRHYFFICYPSIPPSLVIDIRKNKTTNHSTKRTSLNNLISLAVSSLKRNSRAIDKV